MESTIKSLQTWLDEYSVSHQNPINKLIHKICVPLIFISLYWLMFSIPFPANRSAYLNLANLVYLFALIFWFRLSVKVGLVFLLIGFILSISTMLIWAMVYYGMDAPFARMAGVVFAIAWIGQFLGHRIEGKSPSFIKDLQFLLIGPIWVFRRK